MVATLHGKRIINAGVVFGPASEFEELWLEASRLVKSLNNWGTMQLVINYLFHKNGFVELPYGYNFIIMTAMSKYRIRDGRFHDEARPE
jgi:hypothetical protein